MDELIFHAGKPEGSEKDPQAISDTPEGQAAIYQAENLFRRALGEAKIHIVGLDEPASSDAWIVREINDHDGDNAA